MLPVADGLEDPADAADAKDGKDDQNKERQFQDANKRAGMARMAPQKNLFGRSFASVSFG